MFELVLGSNEGSGKVILLRGEIDIYSAPDFKDNLFRPWGIAGRTLFWIVRN